MYCVITPFVDLKLKADSTSETQTQILYGETVRILEGNHADFFHVSIIQKNDSYAGYVLKTALRKVSVPATHRVIYRSTLLLTQADIKSPSPMIISLGSCVSVTQDINDIFYKTDTGHYIFKKHIMPINHFLDFSIKGWIDFLYNNFYHTPYLWGGRSVFGIDCSGLVQLSLQAYGIFLPRDSGPQKEFLTDDVPLTDIQAGDIIFWAGHVGIMVNKTDLIHANAYHMATITEKLSDVIARNPNPVTAIKRTDTKYGLPIGRYNDIV